MPGYNKRNFIFNMLTMSVSMLAVRIGGICFNIYFTSIIGAQNTGMFHLIFSVYGFMLTFSVSGTGITVTRLVSEAAAADVRSAASIVRRCCAVCLCTSCTAAAAVIFGSNFVSRAVTGSDDAALGFILLGISLPCAATSGVFRGYFMAVRRVGFVTLSQLVEEGASALITIFMLFRLRDTDMAYISAIFGISASAFVGVLIDFVMYRAQTEDRFSNTRISVPYRSILSISVPIALGSYLRSALVSVENVLIPGRLALSGVDSALARYGTIKGMSMPLMYFPAVFISAFASMLVTELADRNASRKTNGIKYISQKACEYTLYFSFMIAAVLFLWGGGIANFFYPGSDVGQYLVYLSFLVIPMYLDSVVDSMLKGLNQQMSSLLYNIIDSVLRIALIWFIIPQYGVTAYIIILYASEIFNLTLSIARLARVSNMRLGVLSLILPVVCGTAALLAVKISHSGFTDIFVFVFTYCFAATGAECIRRTKISHRYGKKIRGGV